MTTDRLVRPAALARDGGEKKLCLSRVVKKKKPPCAETASYARVSLFPVTILKLTETSPELGPGHVGSLGCRLLAGLACSEVYRIV